MSSLNSFFADYFDCKALVCILNAWSTKLSGKYFKIYIYRVYCSFVKQQFSFFLLYNRIIYCTKKPQQVFFCKLH